jgi:transcriptional regulator with XRE-family HTH domain
MASDKTRRLIGANVAAILREERLKAKLSLAAVAERSGLSYQMVSYVEREMREPSLDTLLRITEALNLDAAEVLKRAQESVTRKVIFK